MASALGHGVARVALRISVAIALLAFGAVGGALATRGTGWLAEPGAWLERARGGEWSLPVPTLPDIAWPRLELPDLASALRRPGLELERVEFMGLRVLGAEELMDRLGLAAPLALVDVRPDAVCERLARHPRIADCRAARMPPDRLLVDVSERVAVARLADSNTGLDANGERFPLAPGEALGLPRINGAPGAVLGLAAAAHEAGLPLASITGRPGEIWFEPADASVRVRATGSPERIVRDWLRLEATGLARAHGAREVDLRFGNRAVLRGAGSGGSGYSGQTEGGTRHGPS